MNEIKIKNEFSGIDLMKGTDIIKIAIEESIIKEDFFKNKMLTIMCYLDIRTKEVAEEKEIKKDKLIEFYNFLREEIYSLYNSRLIESFRNAQTGTLRTSLSLKVTTDKLVKYNINFSMPINSILALITAQENLIILE
ncbi:hypothetical protein KST83_10685 [Fusobacterium nucleatum]|uniref:Uncharacterized protein n=1 Tax=Fusobacterium nucleatum subsp. polymorphum TaxID=76857 RepID=A0A2C6AYE2_FUSNP|nr:hypothetical protein [Fusobacterium polymorphum]PHH96614.1 hypothetical protein CA840_04270 [Fusobacterium polymorphum]